MPSVRTCASTPSTRGRSKGVAIEPATIETRMTTTKKVVPQRGCSFDCLRTFSTVSGKPCS